MIKKLNFIIYIFIIQNCWLLQAQQPMTIFCHGIVDNKTQADRYEQFLQEPKTAFDFPDAQTPEGYNLNNLIFQCSSFFGKPVNRDTMHMGQSLDIETLKNQIKPDNNYILYGVSRGGATTISYLAKHNPDNVQALIIDAAPADMITAVDELQHKIGYKFAADRDAQEYIFNTIFPAYSAGSTPPVDDIINIVNKDLPIFIVHAHTDTTVTIQSAWRYYVAFLQAGFTHVYLCELQVGKHAHYMKGPDSSRYLQALHSFYKAHNLTYNDDYATMDIRELQPSAQEIIDKLEIAQQKTLADYETQKAINIAATQTIVALLLLATAIYFYKK